MATSSTSPTIPALKLQLAPTLSLDDEQLLALCEQNRELRIERSAEGNLEMMSPAGGKTADRNAELIMQLRLWARETGTGRAFDSSGGFLLPNGAMRSPDASWVRISRLRELSRQDQERFLPLCPEFVAELRSPSDSLQALQAKMVEYLANGCRLAWLIDPSTRRAHVYRPESTVEVLEEPTTLPGDPELPGFRLQLAEIWQPSW